MKPRSTRLAVERIEDRTVPSTLAYGDFNHAGLLDIAAVTSPTTITVSLAHADGSYTVSATLHASKGQPVTEVYVGDRNNDGKLDISAGGIGGNYAYVHNWYGNGDGTFSNRDTEQFRFGRGF
jgi:hypothetical protein